MQFKANILSESTIEELNIIFPYLSYNINPLNLKLKCILLSFLFVFGRKNDVSFDAESFIFFFLFFLIIIVILFSDFS